MDRRRFLLVALVALAIGGTVGGVATTLILRRPPRVAAPELRDGEEPARAGAAAPVLAGADAPTATVSAGDLIPLGDAPDGMGVVCAVSAIVRAGDVGVHRKPLAGVRVRLRLDAPEPTDVPTHEGTTDDVGEVRFGPFPVPRVPRRLATHAALVAEPLDVRASVGFHFGRAIVNERAFEAPAPSSGVRWFRTELTVLGAPVLEGVVVTSDGRGIPGAVVTADDPASPPDELADFDVVLRGLGTEDRGAFRVEAPGPGRTRLSAVLDTWADPGVTATEILDVPVAGRKDLRIVLEGVGRVAGRLLESDGRPAADAEVCLTPTGRSVAESEFAVMVSSGFRTPRPPVLRRRVAADGSFEFVGTVPDVAYDVRSWTASQDEVVLAEKVPSGTTSLDLRVSRHGVEPHLVDARDGLPVYGLVLLRTPGGQHVVGSDPLWDGPSGKGLLAPVGTVVTVLAQARGYEDVSVKHVVSDRPGLDDLRIRMTPAGATPAVRIRCIDERGRARPWRGAHVVHEPTRVVLDEGDTVEGDTLVTTRLRPGAYVLTCGAGAPGEEDRFRAPGTLRLVVPPTEAPDVALWSVPTGGALRITFRAQDGTILDPGDLRSVRAQGDGDEFQIDLFHQREDGAWREGTGPHVPYETRTLVPGTYDVTWYDRGEGGNALSRVRVEVVAGSLTQVEFRR